METILLSLRLLLAVVFGVSGIAKLLDPKGTRQAVVGFGVPDKLAAPVGTLAPAAELAVAVLLVPVATAWWGALGALGLLFVFTGAVGVTLAKGKKPDCH